MSDDPWRAKYWGDGVPEDPDMRDGMRAGAFIFGWVLIAGILIAWAYVAWKGMVS